MQNSLEETFEQVLAENNYRIYRICKIYARPPIEAQDLFQEVIYHIWTSLSTFKAKSSANTWVYKIALNVCYRSKMQLERRNYKTEGFESIQFIPTKRDNEEYAQEKYKALQVCISTLNESDTSIIVLYLEDLPYKEIATITGLSENHIAVKMKRIRKKLFDCITPKLK